MPRPATKPDLSKASDEQFDKLWKLIDDMGDDARTAPFSFEDRDRSVRDVLVNLYEWHELLLAWLAANTAGQNRPFLPEPYNWKTYPAMNVEFWKKHQSTSYADAEAWLKESHARAMSAIDSLTEAELFEKKHFAWTGSTNVGSYCISATSSHYDWALKKLKKHVKTHQEAVAGE